MRFKPVCANNDKKGIKIKGENQMKNYQLIKSFIIYSTFNILLFSQYNPINNKRAISELISDKPKQNIVIDIEHTKLHNDSFISVSEYLKDNKYNVFNPHNDNTNYDELLNLQNQGVFRNKPNNWNMQNAIQFIDNISKEIDASSIPQSLKKIS